MSDFQLPVIKTKEELNKLLKYLNDQGFGYFSDWEYHNKKIDKIINNANKMNISYDNKLKTRLSDMSDYTEIEKEANAYFSKFSPDDKIFELLNSFYLQSDASTRVPYHRPDIKDIIEWVTFRKKYGLIDEYKPGTKVNYYNLDKNYLKIYSRQYNEYEFKQLYEYIYNEKPLEWNNNRAGEWMDIGKIEIKYFVKGGAQIKGDINKFKEYYYKHLIKRHYKHTNDIIKYNNKVVKLIGTEEY